jgi:taurine dioxygenase
LSENRATRLAQPFQEITAMSAVRALDQHQHTDLTITPLQPTIGAEIGGIDLRQPLRAVLRDEIKAALLKHRVIFFRDQHIDREQHIAFAGQFGPIYHFPVKRDVEGYNQIHKIKPEYSRLTAAGSPAEEYGNGAGYHTDTSWRLVPTWGAVLRAVDLPPLGGDTIWVDAHLAYEGLPQNVKERLAALHVVHDMRHTLPEEHHHYPVVAHPIVRTHRETGEKILWVNYSARPTVIRVDRSESTEILRIVADQYKRPEHQVRFSWRPGSIAFWDNRATVHYAVRNYGDYPRLLERILIGESERLYADL